MLHLAPCLLLRNPLGRRTRAATTRALLSRTTRFLRGEWAPLIQEAIQATRAAHRPQSAGVSVPIQGSPPATSSVPLPGTRRDCARSRRARRSIQQALAGAPSRALQALISEDLPASTPEVITALRAAHPAPSTAIPPELHEASPTRTPPTCSPADLRTALLRAPRGSGSGPSGWIFEHLRELVTDSPSLLSAFAHQCTRLAGGMIPSEARPFYTSSRLIALAKPDGRVRPIAIGEVLQRITARWLCSALRSRMARALLPLQFGIGVPCGPELIYRAVQRMLLLRPDWAILTVDIRNAFNSQERAPMALALEAEGFADLLPYFLFFYGADSALHFQPMDVAPLTLSSRRGVRQGDPLGPFFYALGQQHALRQASRVLGSLPIERMEQQLEDDAIAQAR